MPFKKPLILLLLIALGAAGWMYVVPSFARGKIETFLVGVGYRPHAIGDVIVQPPYIMASNIQLDRDGFDTIDLLRVKVADASLTPVEIHIDNLRTASTVESPAAIFRLIGAFQQTLPAARITIDGMVSDFATDHGDIRLETTLAIDSADDKGDRILRAVVKARQYQLSFDTRWAGTINAAGAMMLDAEILDGRLNIGPARLSRLVGWFNWNGQSSDVPTLSGQIDIGSGTLFNMPLQNISLTAGGTTEETDILFRTGLSGTSSMMLSMDTKLSPTGNSYDAVLDIKNADTFFTHVQTLNPKAVPDALRQLGSTQVYLDYREDRRFTGGPLPFELRAIADEKRATTGNILIYPDTLELRGSAQMEEPLAIAVQQYFGIATDKRTGGALRLDGSIKDLFAPEGSGVSAGIENNPGE